MIERGDARGDGKLGLGFMYAHGNGVNKDGDKAFELYREAAGQGSRIASIRLLVT